MAMLFIVFILFEIFMSYKVKYNATWLIIKFIKSRESNITISFYKLRYTQSNLFTGMLFSQKKTISEI